MFRFSIAILAALAAPAAAWAQDPQSLEDRVKELERKLAQQPATNPATALNPTVTVIGNMLWRQDDKNVFLEGDPAEPRIDDTFNVREVELDLRAAIDPYADGIAVLAIEAEVPGQYEVTVEEFFATIKSLPFGFWESPPLATKIRIGRMRVDFGRINKLHLHDLPQSQYGLLVSDFLGEEGYVANGISTSSILGSVGETGVFQLNLNALQGGGSEVAADTRVPNYLAGLTFYTEVAEGHSIDLGLYGHYGGSEKVGHQRYARTFSLDALYKWKPAKQGEWNSFIVGAQVIKTDRDFINAVDTDFDGVPDTFIDADSQAMGFLIWAQYQLDRRWYVGLRYDRSEFITDDSKDHSRITPYVSCYLSEFFRIRGSVELTTSDLRQEDDLTTFLFELNVVYGAHPPHPFWVNR
jgi:hypothetical protein